MTFRKILTTAVGVPENATDDQIARAMAEMLGQGSQTASVEAQSVADDPQGEFERLSELYAKTHGVSLAEGYSRVSAECPILFERARRAADTNRVVL